MATRCRPRRYRASRELMPLVHLWILRILVPLNGAREFIYQHGFHNDTLAELIGLEEWIDPADREFDARKAHARLRELHQEAERRFRGAGAPEELSRNISRLSDLVGLSATDCRILELAVLLQTEKLLDDTADWLGTFSSVKLYATLAQLIDCPETEIRLSLCAQGILARSGLVSVDRSCNGSLRSKLDLISSTFADMITASADDPVNLLKGTVIPQPASELSLADYVHIDKSLAILRPYLKQALASGRCGVNVFVHGDPGTGKSQLARALAADMGCELFGVASEDSDGDPVGGERRLRAYRAAQCFFAKRSALVVFDEVEDVFNDGDGFFGKKSTAQTRKAWINRMLEENPVPAVWLSNSIDCLDPAFVRRFDMIVELPVPPQSQRQRIIREVCGGLVSESTIRIIAEASSLAPAVVTRAAAVIETIRSELPQGRIDASLTHLISSTLEGQRHRPLRQSDPDRLPETYDPAFINADADLTALGAGLAETRSGRLCLYGPPGTGKTAYARWLAVKLDMPLLVRRASDLLSKWVGGTEANLARAFREAEESRSLLLIDEVDSFLQDRRGASHSWEVTAVNEMLTCMESFSGIFIASTNLMTGLDQAALRRFDLKVRFGYLTPDQAWQLFQRQCRVLGMDGGAPEIQLQLSRLAVLTPGDFAAVARQSGFRPIRSPEALLRALGDECVVKEGGKKTAIGFL